MGALLTEGWLAQPLSIPQLRPEFAAVASVVVVGDGNTNIAPVTSANQILTSVGLTRGAGPGGNGWRGDGSTGLNTMYQSAGKVAKVVNATMLTLVFRFSTTDTSSIQYGAGTLDTGANYGETLTFNRQADAGASYGAGFLCADLRSDATPTAGAFAATSAAVTQYFDGKPHVMVQQWSVSSSNVLTCRIWVDGVEQAVTHRAADPFSQAVGRTEFDYHVSNRNNRNVTASTSLNGTRSLFARFLSNTLDGRSLSINPWQMFEAPALDLYIPDVAGGTEITPGLASVALTGYAPTISQPIGVAPGVASLAISGYAPTIAQPVVVTPGVASVALSGYAPTISQLSGQNILPDVGALSITGYAPSVGQSQSVSPSVALVAITGYAPTVSQSAALIARPVADALAGAWLPSSGSDLWGMLDEVVPDDADYIYALAPSTCRVTLSTVADPLTSSGQVVSYRAHSPAGAALSVSLKCGATLIAQWDHASLPLVPTTFTQALTPAQCDAITDYASLVMEFAS